MQRTCTSGFMDAAKCTCPGAPCAPRGWHPQCYGLVVQFLHLVGGNRHKLGVEITRGGG